MMHWYTHYGGHPGWAGWVLMSVMMVALWALVIFAGYAVYRLATGRGTGVQPPALPATSSARRLLDERFARGEIDEDEYVKRRDLLGTGP